MKIRRQHGFRRHRSDPQLFETGFVARHHVIAAQQVNLIAGQDRFRPEFQEPGQKFGQPKGNRGQESFAAGIFQQQVHDFLEAVDRGSAEFIRHPGRGGLGKNFHDCIGNVAGKDRLKPGAAVAIKVNMDKTVFRKQFEFRFKRTAEYRQHPGQSGQPGKKIEEVITSLDLSTELIKFIIASTLVIYTMFGLSILIFPVSDFIINLLPKLSVEA